MADERTRILRMLAEGKISVEECDGLLNSLSVRRTEKIVQDVAGAKEKRPIWPFLLLVLLGIVSMPVLVLLGIVVIPMLILGVAAVHVLPACFAVPLAVPFAFPLTFPFAVLLFGFCVWMLIDRIRRPKEGTNG